MGKTNTSRTGRLKMLIEKENRTLKDLLQRCKETFEPFPIVSDLRSMTKTLREKHDETETKAIKAMFKKAEAKNRKLYQDISDVLR